MGGYGSTRWGNYQTRKQTVESCYRIDVSAVIKTPDARLTWTQPAPFGLTWTTHKRGDLVVLKYTLQRHGIYSTDFTDQVRVVHVTYPNKASKRYFVCKWCRQNVRYLYKPIRQEHFKCRKCHDLIHRSTRESRYVPKSLIALFGGSGIPEHAVRNVLKTMFR